MADPARAPGAANDAEFRRRVLHAMALEARFDAPTFAARVMLEAARGLAELAPGAHRHALR